MYEKQIELIKQKIAEVQMDMRTSTHDLSIAIETAPKQSDTNYDHLERASREELVRKDI